MNELTSHFEVVCKLARLYPDDKVNNYIDTGNILETVLREFLATKVHP